MRWKSRIVYARSLYNFRLQVPPVRVHVSPSDPAMLQRDGYRSDCGGTSKTWHFECDGRAELTAMTLLLDTSTGGYFRCCGHWAQQRGYKFREWLGNCLCSYSHWRPAWQYAN